MEKLLLPIIFLSSFLLANGSLSQTVIKEIAAISIGGLFIAWWLWRFNKFFSLFVLWLLMRTFLPPIQPRAMFELSNVLIASGIYLGIQYLDIDKRKLFNGVCIASALQIIAVFMQWLNLFPFWNGAWDEGRIWGLFGNSNWSGCFIAMIIPFFFTLKDRYLRALGITSGFVALLILDSQFALLSGIVGVLAYFYIKHRDFILKKGLAYLILVLILGIIPVAMAHPPNIANERFDLWLRIWWVITGGGNTEWGCHFLQGYGLGSGFQAFPVIAKGICHDPNLQWHQAHNEYLQVLFQYGIIGLLLITGLIISTVKKISIRNVVLASSLIALLADSLGFFPMRTSPIGYMAVMFLALIDREDRDAVLL